MFLKLSRVTGALLAALCLAFSAVPRAYAQESRDASAAYALRADLPETSNVAARRSLPKRLVLLRAGGDPEGSRVTISSDSPLDDCESSREGDDYTVRIPWAVAADARGVSTAGRFYQSARVEEQGDAVLVTFTLREGAAVSLVKGFNRIEVTFADGTRQPSAAAAPQPAAAPPSSASTCTE